MTRHDLARRPLATERAPWLRGRLGLPGDPSSSRSALILGALARGETVIEGLAETRGVLALAQALQALGARIEKRGGRWHVMGVGAGGLLEPEGDLDFGDSAASLTLAMGLAGIYDFTTRFTGDAWLSSQPLDHVLEPLQALGVEVVEHHEGRLPIALRGPRLLVPPLIRLPAAAPAVKDCLLLAGLAIPGTTMITECRGTPGHLERLLPGFGARLEHSTDGAGDLIIELEGLPNLRAHRVEIPGDSSLAAFATVAGLIVPGSEIIVPNVSITSLGATLLPILLEMGGAIEVVGRRVVGGEEIADLRVSYAPLRGVTVPAGGAVPTTGHLAALAVAAALATGETRLEGLQVLPADVRHTLAAIAAGLRDNGVHCELDDDDMVILGAGRAAGGGRVRAGEDPWFGLAFLVLGMAAEAQVTIDDQAAVVGAFPEFIRSLEDIGASFIGFTE